MSVIKKPSELSVQTTIKMLVYGQPGLGKTTLALSSPSPLLLDFDGGVHRVNTMYQTDTVQVSSWEDVISVLRDDLSPYKTLVFDTAGKMLDYMSAYLIKNEPKLGRNDGALTLQGYGSRKAMFTNLLKQVSVMGKNLIFVAHDKEEKEGDQKIVRPEIGGSSGGDLIKELDLVGYMEAIGKKRTISFDPCEKFYGKNTCQLPAIIELPLLEDGVSNNKLSDIFHTYQENLEHRKVIASDYNDLIELIKSNVDDVNSPEAADDFVSWMGSVSHVWDSKLQAQKLFRIKVKALGLTLNANNKYEPATKTLQNEPAEV